MKCKCCQDGGVKWADQEIKSGNVDQSGMAIVHLLLGSYHCLWLESIHVHTE